MNLEDIMLSEINQSHIKNYFMVPHMQGTYSGQIYREEEDWCLLERSVKQKMTSYC